MLAQRKGHQRHFEALEGRRRLRTKPNQQTTHDPFFIQTPMRKPPSSSPPGRSSKLNPLSPFSERSRECTRRSCRTGAGQEEDLLGWGGWVKKGMGRGMCRPSRQEAPQYPTRALPAASLHANLVPLDLAFGLLHRPPKSLTCKGPHFFFFEKRVLNLIKLC